MDRRKVIDQAISTLQLTEELDWDRLLWIPGEKRFFFPSIELATGMDWGFAPSFLQRSLTIEMLEETTKRVFQNLYLGSWDNPPAQPELRQFRGYDIYCECVPSRSQFFVEPRQVRVPVKQGILYDRYDRRLID